jgi:hypothetical protein
LIDFRYHLVSIVAVFLALAIGIVLGSTALQGDTIDGLKAFNNSLSSQLSAANSSEKSTSTLKSADDQVLQAAAPQLLKGRLPGDNVVLVTEPGAPSDVVSGIEGAVRDAGAAISGTIALQPKFNDLTGATQSQLETVNTTAAATDSFQLSPAVNPSTGDEQNAAQLISEAVLEQQANEPGLSAADAQTLLKSYVAGGFLTYQGAPYGTGVNPAGDTVGRATLAVIVTAQETSADGANDPADEVLLALAGEFALGSAATLVAGPVMQAPDSQSPITVLRNSSASGQVSSVDNASTVAGQISLVWALQNQVQGGKPGSYGVLSSATSVSPVPSPVPSATPTTTPSAAATSTKGTGKVKKTVSTK